MGNRNKSNFIIQSSILAFSSILVRIIGLAYRIPLYNIVGDDGMGVYAIAFNIYSLMLLISSYSLPLAVSKMVSARISLGKMRNSYHVFLGALGYSTSVGIVVSLITYFGADFFAKLYGNPLSSTAIKVLAPALVIMSVLGVFRGYFQGLGNMIPTAISNIFEQIANAIISIVAALYLVNFAKNVNEKNAYGAAGGTLGTLSGAFVALIFMCFVFYIYRKSVIVKQNRRDHNHTNESYKEILKILTITIAPVIFNTTIYNLSSLTDSGIFNNIMDLKGVPFSEYNPLIGIYTGQYIVLANVPIAFASALSSSIIPTLSSSIAKGDIRAAINKINAGIRFSMLIAIPCAVGLSILSTPIMEMLFGYRGLDITLGSNMLKWGSVLIIVYSLSTVSNAILQGIDKISVPVKHSFISFVLHLFLLIPLILYTDLGVYSLVISNIFFAFCVTILNAFALRRHLGYKQEILKTFIAPIISSSIMGVITFFSYKLINTILNNIFSTLLSIILSVIVYVILLLKLNVVGEDELLRLPKGQKLIKLIKKMHIIN